MLLILISQCQTKRVERNLSFDGFWTCSVFPDHWRIDTSSTNCCVKCIQLMSVMCGRFLARSAIIGASSKRLRNRPERKHWFRWTGACRATFVMLKKWLTSAPIMASPRDEGQFVLDTLLSLRLVLYVLSQMQPDQDQQQDVKIIAWGQSNHAAEISETFLV